MVRFPHDAAHALEPAIQFLAQFGRNALASRRPSRPGPYTWPSPPSPGPTPGEDRFSILESYDTVFLVDDSPSMLGKRWDLVKRILTYSLALATQYDPDGIDIHFLNNKTANVNNIKDQAIAVEIHRQITLRGSTPILDQLSRHLNDYLRRFKSAQDFNFKGYNLIVLTDGEPDPEYEDPHEISDREDAKVNSAAYRLIRKKIVQIARELQQVRAERTQVGIQFCQVGDDEAASSFFQYLDNRLKGKYELDRDVGLRTSHSILSLFLADLTQMVDTVKCQTEADLTEPFFKKLLLGAIDKTLDQQESIAAPSSYNNYTHHPNQPTRRATASGDRQQPNNRNSRGKNWDIDQRPAESSYQMGQYHSAPDTATLNHPYAPNSPHQPPRFLAEPNLGQTSEQQQPFQERPPRPFAEQALPHRLIHPSTMPPEDRDEQHILANNPGKSPRHRLSLGFGLNKRWRQND